MATNRTNCPPIEWRAPRLFFPVIAVIGLPLGITIISDIVFRLFVHSSTPSSTSFAREWFRMFILQLSFPVGIFVVIAVLGTMQLARVRAAGFMLTVLQLTYGAILYATAARPSPSNWGIGPLLAMVGIIAVTAAYTLLAWPLLGLYREFFLPPIGSIRQSTTPSQPPTVYDY